MQGSDVTGGSPLVGLGAVEALGAARKSETGPVGAGAGAAPAADQATLSTVGGLVAASAAESDVRLDKVAPLKAAIEAGTYSVSSSDVAEKLITSLLR